MCRAGLRRKVRWDLAERVIGHFLQIRCVRRGGRLGRPWGSMYFAEQHRDCSVKFAQYKLLSRVGNGHCPFRGRAMRAPTVRWILRNDTEVVPYVMIFSFEQCRGGCPHLPVDFDGIWRGAPALPINRPKTNCRFGSLFTPLLAQLFCLSPTYGGFMRNTQRTRTKRKKRMNK